MKVHIRKTIEDLINYRNLFCSDSDIYKKTNDSVLLLIENFTPCKDILKTLDYYNLTSEEWN